MDQTDKITISSGSGRESECQERSAANRYLRQARWLLENYRNLLDQKARQEAEIKATPHYTRSDVIYHLSGFGAVDFKERVQTSTISDPTQNAAVNLGKTLQQMNEEVLREVADGYEELCRNIAVVEIAFMSMDSDVRNVAEQLYKQGRSWREIIAPDGHFYCYRTVREYKFQALVSTANALARRAALRKSYAEWSNHNEG